MLKDPVRLFALDLQQSERSIYWARLSGPKSVSRAQLSTAKLFRPDFKAFAVPVSTHRARVLAFYLPQYHPIPENDEWWGPGFTEWTNVAPGAPAVPWARATASCRRDLGFYDLRVPETRAAQAAARSAARRRGVLLLALLVRAAGGSSTTFDEVLSSGEPRCPFALGWANQTWTGIWHGAADRMLIEQTYPGEDDHRRHFEYLLQAFADDRYFKVDGKPLFYIYEPTCCTPELRTLPSLWRQLANAPVWMASTSSARQRAPIPSTAMTRREWDSTPWCRSGCLRKHGIRGNGFAIEFEARGSSAYAGLLSTRATNSSEHSSPPRAIGRTFIPASSRTGTTRLAAGAEAALSPALRRRSSRGNLRRR